MRLWAAMGGCTSMLLLLTGAAALDCHADFWPEMHASPRRLEALILANGALVKLCFDADADGAVHRQHARAFLKAAGLVVVERVVPIEADGDSAIVIGTGHSSS